MPGHPLRRPLTVVASAALLASLTVAAVAAPASAAKKVTCRGQAATIVGTNGPDRLVGTNRKDVIAGLGGNDAIIGGGGNDLICGGTGRDRLAGKGGRDRLYGNGGPDILIGGTGPDRLFGGVGNDRLTGQAGNDTLGGGPGTDTCYQGTGAGLSISCELPAAPPVVAPPPPGPTLIPLDGILAVAWSDVNGNHVFDVEDVLISKLVDTSENGTPSAGDTIVMGNYPTNLAGSSFGAWGVHEHSVDSVYVAASYVRAKLSSGAEFAWSDSRLVYPELAPGEAFTERHSIMIKPDSVFQDTHYPGTPGPEASLDALVIGADSPSQPQGPELDLYTTRATDDGFVDVKIPTSAVSHSMSSPCTRNGPSREGRAFFLGLSPGRIGPAFWSAPDPRGRGMYGRWTIRVSHHTGGDRHADIGCSCMSRRGSARGWNSADRAHGRRCKRARERTAHLRRQGGHHRGHPRGRDDHRHQGARCHRRAGRERSHPWSRRQGSSSAAAPATTPSPDMGVET